MKHARSVIFKTLRLLTLASACVAVCAHADEYADASQLVRTNKFAEALTKVDSYLATKPADPQMRFLKGVIQRNLGKQADAITTFNKLTEDYPELPEPYNNLAVLYAGQGQYDKARVALEMAIRTNPSYSTAHENIGDVYARLASQAYNKALQLDSANMAVPPKLALIRELFKPNLPAQRTASATPAAPAAIVPAAPPSVAPVAPTAPVLKPQPPAPTAAPVAVPAPVVVAAKPAPVAPPKTAPAASPADTNTGKDPEAAVLAWAQAWSSKDMTAYLGAYSPDFTPPGKQTRSVWEQDRRDRITGKSHINVKITEIKAKLSGDEAVVKFRQAYKADSLSVSSRKTLVLHKTNNQWLITKESTGN
jgi:tetratricopeptide (TPR) repeat protein